MIQELHTLALNWLGVLPPQFEFCYAIFIVLFTVMFIMVCFSPFYLLMKLVR